MTSEIEQAKILTELQDLKTYLENDLDLESQIIDRDESGTPLNSLVVVLEPDWQERSRVASLNFIPLEETDLESLKLLQFYCQVPTILNSDFLTETLQFLMTVNLQIPLGSFILSEQEISFKYVYALGKFKMIDREEFLETFLLWIFTLDKVSGLIEAVGTGEQDLQSACQSLL